ncbi:hypothetical protein BaRGS_00003326 [Batillaria attramentaria]|uniref:Uncharacterized protein n=1 Tax=Batillaria attramentaria TaxID=370345 RepID=A0ABD0M259_9CAEN
MEFGVKVMISLALLVSSIVAKPASQQQVDVSHSKQKSADVESSINVFSYLDATAEDVNNGAVKDEMDTKHIQDKVNREQLKLFSEAKKGKYKNSDHAKLASEAKTGKYLFSYDKAKKTSYSEAKKGKYSNGKAAKTIHNTAVIGTKDTDHEHHVNKKLYSEDKKGKYSFSYDKTKKTSYSEAKKGKYSNGKPTKTTYNTAVNGTKDTEQAHHVNKKLYSEVKKGKYSDPDGKSKTITRHDDVKDAAKKGKYSHSDGKAKKASPRDGKPSASDLKLTVEELFLKLDLLQVKRDHPFIAPMLWEEHKGMYPSYVRLNFVGKPEIAELRELISVFDNNMFATAWITICLLETHCYASGPTPSSAQLHLSLDAVAQHYDRNRNYNNSIMAFWPQAYEKNASRWVSTPANLLKAFDVLTNLPWDEIDKVLELLGLKNIEDIVKKIIDMQSLFTQAFHIPPDFDDTFVNLGLGALLTDLGPELPEALSRWRHHNTNLTSVLDALKSYAYRPFSQDKNVNTIDPRTYYYIRHFLDYAKNQSLDVALVPTWIQNIEEARENFDRDVVMPFQVNNVDVTVAANAVYGITASVLSGLLPPSVLQDPQLRQIYHNTTSLIAFMVEKALFGRPDLALTYYPSVFEFYWFVARTYHRMETALRSQPLPEVRFTTNT